MGKNSYEGFHKNTIPQRRILKKNNFTYRIILDVVNKYIKIKDSILDIGCGAGSVALYLASKGYRVHGIDISIKAIQACIESARLLNLKNVSFEPIDFTKKLPNKKFNLIICTEVLEHLEDDRRVLSKIFSILKSGGIAIISTPSKNAPLFRIGYARKFDEKVGHLRRYSMDELVSKCKEQGFMILEMRKAEGIIRNFLFINSVAGKFVRFIKFFVSDLVTIIDNISIHVFGESNIFIVIKKT